MRAIDDAQPTTQLAVRPRALIVEQDVSGLLVARRLLRSTPYQVDTARSAREALKALDRCKYAAVVVDDERLPDASGAELLAQVERRQPEALRLLVAEAGRARELESGARAGRYRLVPRPFFARPLLEALSAHQRGKVAPRRERPKARDTSRRTDLRLASLVRRRMLVTMAEVVEARLGSSPGHAVRVSTLAGALARELGMAGESVEIVEEAALAHDLGELGVDPPVFALRRRLTPRELEAMRRHAEVSHRIAHRSGLTLAALAGVRHHHERWDGQGYPDHLKGDGIPVVARVVAVADTWDALASARPYRTASPLLACARQLRSLSGSQLDPNLVRLFLERRVHETLDYESAHVVPPLF